MSRFHIKPQFVFVVLAACAAGAWAWYRAVRDPAPPVPEVELPGAHPEVASAVRAAVDALRNQPRDPAAWGEVCHLLIANGYHERALPLLEQAQRLEPGNPSWPYLHASVDMLIGKPRQAAAKFEEALPLARNPEERSAILFYKSQLDIELGDLALAERDVGMLREAEGESPRTWFATGLFEYARGNRTAARDRLLLVAEHPSARKQACAILASLDHPDSTMASRFRMQAKQLPADLPWTTSFDKKVRDHRIRISSGLELFQELSAAGRHEEALRHLQEHLEQSPSENGFFSLGRTLLQDHDLRGAEAALGRALAMNGKNTKARMFLGAAILEQADELYAANRKDEAVPRFLEAIRIESAVVESDPNSALPFFLLGRAQLRLNRLEDAKQSLRKAVLIAPDLSAAWQALGELLAEQGQWAQAIESLENAVRSAPPQDPEPQKALDKWKAKAKEAGK